ncbi:MAG: hypothetical protein A2X40_08150 [Elusimicrobia bacterium GWC2_65_9]|nr:MAG: hypothetical protein A2X40_08150 [Elusimicrobia bacterium GWC2_65_9]OHC66079.1 MAG: hypothetical protein A2040_03825 [Rhodocyclales bacterium GWA2_65_19]
MKRITIIVPVYREGKTLPSLYRRLEQVAAGLPAVHWDYIFVDDGSPDDSMAVLRGLAQKDPKIKIIGFSRNFGKEIALSAGMHAVKRSDAVICIDADLQHPPELIAEMVSAWRQGADIVATIRTSSAKQPLLRRLGSSLFYRLMNKISGVEMVSKTTDFRLYDKKVVEVFEAVTERERLFRGIMDWMGFKTVYIKFRAGVREAGNSSFSYAKLFQLAIQSFTSFSLFPLRMTGYLGVLITVSSGLLLARMLFARFVTDARLFTPLAIVVVINTLLIGIVLMSIGLVALYIGTIHTEVVNRPLYVVRERINFE